MPSNSPIRDPESDGGSGTLYIVATPIGNMEDITLRAIRILGDVDFVAAEDTRHTGRLLAHHKIQANLISYQEHNEAERTPSLIRKLKAGRSVALVSDAGTPSVSDPGHRLITTAIAEQIRIIPIPGVSAAVAALSAAGLPTDSFVFIGFPARKKGRRMKQLEELSGEPRTLIFYESPRRILDFLEELRETMGDRHAVLSREMTKLHEEFLRGRLTDLIDQLKIRQAVKGECTLLVTGRLPDEEPSLSQVRDALHTGLSTGDVKLSHLVKAVAGQYGLSRRVVYEEALRLKEELYPNESGS